MTKNEAYKKAAEVLAANNGLNNDRTYHSSIGREDYLDALYSLTDSLDYYRDTDEAMDAGTDHEWADTKSIYARRWAHENPSLLDRYFEEAVDTFGVDFLTEDGSILNRIYEISCYTYYSQVLAFVARDIENLAESYDYEDED
jgi:hypothetical protein